MTSYDILYSSCIEDPSKRSYKNTPFIGIFGCPLYCAGCWDCCSLNISEMWPANDEIYSKGDAIPGQNSHNYHNRSGTEISNMILKYPHPKWAVGFHHLTLDRTWSSPIDVHHQGCIDRVSEVENYCIYIISLNTYIYIYYSIYIIKGSLVANFRYTNFWVAGEE